MLALLCVCRPGEAAKDGKDGGDNRPRSTPQASALQTNGPQATGPVIGARNRDAFATAVNNLAERMNQLAGRG